MIEVEQVRRGVRVRDVLENLGWRIRHRGRADCGLCMGNQFATLSFNDRLWHCFRCVAGGDVFSLVMAARKLPFIDALKQLARLAGLQDSSLADFSKLAEEKRQRERLNAAAEEIQACERSLRIKLRRQIHEHESLNPRVVQRLQELAEGARPRWRNERNLLESYLGGASDNLRRIVAAYYIVSFAEPAERVRFVVEPVVREQLIDRVLETGLVRVNRGCIEVGL
jgi:DNA primase